MRWLALALALLAAPAWGAFTADVISGFETGDLLEFSATNGTPTVVTAAARTGERGVRLDAGSESVSFAPIATIGTGDEVIYGLCAKWADATPGTASSFFSADVSGSAEWLLQLQTDGTVDLEDSTGTAQISTSALSDNTWYCFEVYITHSNTGASELFLDGTSAGTDASADYDVTGAVDAVMVGRSGSIPGTFSGDDFYIHYAVTDSGDRCSVDADRLCEVFWFSGGSTNASPDDNCAGSAGTALDTGFWDNFSQVPWNVASGGEYSTSGAAIGCVVADDVGTGSCTGGPSGCAEFDGTAIVGNWLAYAERSGGGSTTMYQRWGNGVDAPQRTTITLETAPGLFRQTSASGTILPTASEFCEVGIEKSTGGRDFEHWENHCYVLHQPPSVAPATRSRAHVIGGI